MDTLGVQNCFGPCCNTISDALCQRLYDNTGRVGERGPLHIHCVEKEVTAVAVARANS